MRLNDAYRLLDADPNASDEEIKRTHRDLTKVWHPDRFGNDAALRQKAEEKLKAINAAYETIRASREGRGSRGFAADYDDAGAADDSGAWRVRWQGREMRVAGLAQIAALIHGGTIRDGAEVFDPTAGRWIALADIPELRAALTRKRVQRSRTWAIACVTLALFILLRRPTPGGLAIAAVLFCLAFVFVMRMRTGNAS